jgi:hypothetical protein
MDNGTESTASIASGPPDLLVRAFPEGPGEGLQRQVSPRDRPGASARETLMIGLSHDNNHLIYMELIMNSLLASMPNLLDLAEASGDTISAAVAFSIAADDRGEIGICSDDQPPVISMSVCADEVSDG